MPKSPKYSSRLSRKFLKCLRAPVDIPSTLAQQATAAQLTNLENRYQQLVAQFYQAQAIFHTAAQESRRLQGVVQVKQQVIELLLPYYPHPLTAELQYQIALT